MYDFASICRRCGDITETQYEQDAGLCSFCDHAEDEDSSDYWDENRCDNCDELLADDGRCYLCEPRTHSPLTK